MKDNEISVSAGNMNLCKWTAQGEERGTYRRFCHSGGLCDLCRELSTVPSRSQNHHFLDNDLSSLSTGKVFNPSIQFLLIFTFL